MTPPIPWHQQLEAWHDFYVVVGGGAAGLTGLMFVVVSLSPGAMQARTAPGVRAFVTPTVVLFASVVVVSAVMCMPSMTAAVLAGAVALGSGWAVAYLISVRGHRKWRENTLDRLDWLWYIGLPILSYLLTLTGAVMIATGTALGLELIGGTMILLLVIAIRNAWDLVLWGIQRSRA